MDKDIVRLKKILREINILEEITNGVKREDFLSNIEKQNAVSMILLKIGEFTKGLSESLRKSNSEIPFRMMAGLRDNVAHEYDKLDFDAIWDTVMIDIPRLKLKIAKLV